MSAQIINSNIPPSQTLGECAQRAIDRCFKKFDKCEKKVLQDNDPEPLHQLRVRMRRLRSAIVAFDPVLILPKAISDRHIGKLARILGNVRDWDVLKAKLDSYHSLLPTKENKRLTKIIDRLDQYRQCDFIVLEKTLQGDSYRQLCRSLEDWLKQPMYREIAQLPIQQVLPDLLLPLLSQLFLHPGWLTGWQLGSGIVESAEPTTHILTQLHSQNEALHDLRKQIKRVRYQAELFVDYYGDPYLAQIEEFKQLQDLLGHLQDRSVLQTFLQAQFKEKSSNELPTLIQQLQTEHWELWQRWIAIQQSYLDVEFRQNLRSQILRFNPL
jgi:CHAD domain-containing protein